MFFSKKIPGKDPAMVSVNADHTRTPRVFQHPACNNGTSNIERNRRLREFINFYLLSPSEYTGLVPLKSCPFKIVPRVGEGFILPPSPILSSHDAGSE